MLRFRNVGVLAIIGLLTCGSPCLAGDSMEGRALSFHRATSSPDLQVVIGQILTYSFPSVEVYVSVTDPSAGGAISGLTPANFTLEEDTTGVGDAFYPAPFALESLENINPPLTIVLVADRSLSMNGTPLAEAKDALRGFVKYLGKEDLCGLISFAGDVRVDAPVVGMDEEGRRSLDATISALSTNSSTALFNGIHTALETLHGSQTQAVVIAFADGDDNVGGHSEIGVIDYAKKIGIPVYTVGIESTTFHAETLRRIAEQTGGSYRGGSAAEMESLFTEIKAQIERQYKITFQAREVIRTNTKRLVRVTVTSGGGAASFVVSYWTEPPDCDFGAPLLAGSLGDPVNTANGNFMNDATDLRVNAPGMPLVFRRFYNSAEETAGPLGRGWTHNFNIRLTENDPEKDRISIRWEDGRKDYWLRDGDLFTATNLGNRSDLARSGSDWICTLKSRKCYKFYTDGRLKKILDRNGNELDMTYAPSPNQDRLVGVTHSLGKALNFAYHPDGRLQSVTESLADPEWENRSVSFNYTDGLLTQATDTMGEHVVYAYDAGSRLSSITDPRGVITLRNQYDEKGRVARQFDGKNNQVDFAYDDPTTTNQTSVIRYLKEGSQTREIKTVHVHDGIARLLEIVYPNEKTVEFTYSGNSNRDSILDRNGNTRTFNYDLEGNVTAIRSPDNSVVRLKYNDLDLPISATDPLGYEISWEYDANGNLIKETRWQDKGKTQPITRSWTYNTGGQILTAIDERGKTTAFDYDNTTGYLTQVTDPGGASTRLQYDAAGRRIAMTDARGFGSGDPDHTTTFAYDKAGRLTNAHSPVGDLAYGYDAAGNQTRAVNAREKTTTYEYDNNDALVAVQRPEGANTFYDFDSLNRLRQTRRANETGEQITRYTYDDLDRVAAATRILENGDTLRTDYAYDAQGNALSVVSPSGVAVFGEYDSMNRLTAIRDPLGRTRRAAFDIRGLQSSVTDARGNRTDYHYDALRRLVGVGEPRPDGGDTAYTYDPAGNLETIDDARTGSSVVMQRNYDDRGMLAQETDGDGFPHGYSYDLVGNLQEARLANGITNTYHYDNGNRLERIDYGDGTIATYQYDPNGNLTAMAGPGAAVGKTTFVYDDLDRLTASTDGYGKRVEYGYDKAGNRTSLTYPDGKVVRYSYDRANRLVDIEDWAGRHTGFTYDGEKLASMTYPNKITCYYGYDVAGRLCSMEYKKTDNSILMALHYTRDENGNPVKVDEVGTLQGTIPPEDTSSEYDDDNRLQKAISQAGTTTDFKYEANGNTIQRNDGTTSETFVYDAANRMIRYKSNDGTLVDHIYDARGYRVSRSENDSEVRYILDHGRSMSHVLAETDAPGAITAYYIHGPRLVARISADGTERYYLTNAIGNVMALSDKDGKTTDRYAFTPYGLVIALEGTTENPFTFGGAFGVVRERNNMFFMRARIYHGKSGCFLSKDTAWGSLTAPLSQQRYAYALDSPLQYADPRGLQAEPLAQSHSGRSFTELLMKESTARAKKQEAWQRDIMDIAYEINGRENWLNQQGYLWTRRNEEVYEEGKQKLQKLFFADLLGLSPEGVGKEVAKVGRNYLEWHGMVTELAGGSLPKGYWQAFDIGSKGLGAIKIISFGQTLGQAIGETAIGFRIHAERVQWLNLIQNRQLTIDALYLDLNSALESYQNEFPEEYQSFIDEVSDILSWQ